MPEIIRVGPLELRFLQSKHDTHGSLDLFEMTVPPGAQMPVPHYHRDWDETVYGLVGTMTFTVNGAPHDVRPGGCLFIPRGVMHGFDNRSGTTATCLRADPGRPRPGILPRARCTGRSWTAGQGENARGHAAPWVDPRLSGSAAKRRHRRLVLPAGCGGDAADRAPDRAVPEAYLG